MTQLSQWDVNRTNAVFHHSACTNKRMLLAALLTVPCLMQTALGTLGTQIRWSQVLTKILISQFWWKATDRQYRFWFNMT